MSEQKKNDDRAMFATKIGAIAATVGSAVGLGNVWRFPYEAGAHGGGMFLLCYLVFVVVLGIPLMCSEFIVGRSTRRDVFGAFQVLKPGSAWSIIGYIAIAASVLIMGFYCVVAGWTLDYLFTSLTGSVDAVSPEQYHERFVAFSSNDFKPLLWTLMFLGLNFLILVRGVSKGLERMSNVMMPLLFAIMVVFCIYSTTLPGFKEGMAFFFKPDMAHFDSQTVLGALGQTFFSLSLGMGCMITYGSYLPSGSRLTVTSGITVGCGSLVAFLAGMIIFPAVFSFGISPQAGPPLIFEVLPSIFGRLPLSALWASLFFFLLVIAALSSTISLSEISILYLMEQKGLRRVPATAISVGACAVMAVLCSLSYGSLSGFTLFGLNIFDLCNYVASNILLPLGGLLVALFVGWVLPRSVVVEQMGQKFRLLGVFIFIVRYIAPVAIICVFLASIGII